MSFLRIISSCLLLLTAGWFSPAAGAADDIPFQKMVVERLPDLNTPRGAHLTLLLGDELTVIGGHTDGFKPVETLEYFRDKAWHEVSMAYPHDGGFAARLPDGTVIIGGGSAEPFGIGQSWPVEIYDPVGHQIRTIGVLDRKRAYASALTLPDGQVVIAGNWYAEDAFELYDPQKGFSCLKDFPSGYASPCILPAGENDFLVFGRETNYGQPADGVVERLYGDAFREPLLEEWWLSSFFRVSGQDCCIGDHSYLLSAFRNSDGAVGLLKVTEGVFSEVAMATPLPLTGIGEESINWDNPLQVDRPRRLAWLQGIDRTGRRYFARINYDAILDGGKATFDLFYAECPEGRFFMDPALLLPDGRLVLTGGKAQDERVSHVGEDNFTTSASVWLFHPEPPKKARIPWNWLLAGFLLAAGAAFLINEFWKSRHPVTPVADPAETPSETDAKLRTDLLDQISAIIEEKELWKQKDLRIQDVASELATNRNYISILLNNISGAGFTTLVNGYRIRHAQQILREHPDMLLDDVAEQAGFASRSTFFRNFKAQTGMTPMQWLQEQQCEKS